MESILLSTHYGEGRRPAVSKNDTPPSSCKHGGRMHPPPHPHGTCGRRRRGGTVTPDGKARGAPTGVIPALLQPEQDLGGSRGPSMRGRWIWTEFLCPPPRLHPAKPYCSLDAAFGRHRVQRSQGREAPMRDECPRKKRETRARSLARSLSLDMWGHRDKVAVCKCKPRRGSSPGIQPTGTLIADIQPLSS